jgi:hypothetical protein
MQFFHAQTRERGPPWRAPVLIIVTKHFDSTFALHYLINKSNGAVISHKNVPLQSENNVGLFNEKPFAVTFSKISPIWRFIVKEVESSVFREQNVGRNYPQPNRKHKNILPDT